MISPGLCGTCVHCRRVRNRRGSEFLRCGRARTDARFARYPALPVLICPGHEEGVPPDVEEEETPS